VSPARRRRNPAWARWSDERLLATRLCDLDLRILGTALEDRVRKLYRELGGRKLRFRPHVWLSTEWFSPDGVPGFALPFYLAHPRLVKLEALQTHVVEGATEEECLKLMRHETGHALITAYRLHRRAGWRATFGHYSKPYRSSYRPNTRSRKFVRNLDGWYAQSHPAEDFCETFAVWLRPRERWRQRYARWEARAKLEYVDQEMRRIGPITPVARSREHTESLAKLTTTLEQYYRRKRARYSHGTRAAEDPGLRELFPAPPGRRRAGSGSAAAFLRRHRPRLLKSVVRRTGADLYTTDQVLKRLIERAFQLGLRSSDSERRVRAAAALLAEETERVLAGRRLEFYR
jgi:hypothetical protein